MLSTPYGSLIHHDALGPHGKPYMVRLRLNDFIVNRIVFNFSLKYNIGRERENSVLHLSD